MMLIMVQFCVIGIECGPVSGQCITEAEAFKCYSNLMAWNWIAFSFSDVVQWKQTTLDSSDMELDHIERHP